MPRGEHLPRLKKGERIPGSGRKPGTPNKITRTVKEIVANAVDASQSDPEHPANLANFARTHPKEFWQVASKLIPEEVKAAITGQVTYEVGVVLAAMKGKQEPPQT